MKQLQLTRQKVDEFEQVLEVKTRERVSLCFEGKQIAINQNRFSEKVIFLKTHLVH